MRRRCPLIMAVVFGVFGVSWTDSVSAQSISQALAAAYSSNPELNAARAQTRADDENVAIARSGYRPTVGAFSDLTGSRSGSDITPYATTGEGSFGLTVTQNVFTGFRVKNAVKESEAGVLASRDFLLNTEQNVLFDAAQAYLDVLRDMAILDLRQRNVLFLEEQVSAANERFSVGEATRTDVAQARARLAGSQAAVSLAEANLAISRATFRQVVGTEAGDLIEEFPYSRQLPGDLEAAVAVALSDHPIVRAASDQADAQAFVVKQIQGELLPTVSVQGSVEHDESFNTETDPNTFSITGRLSIPLYQGGVVAARVRQAKEVYGRLLLQIDLTRDQVRTAVVTAWAQAKSSRGAITAAEQGVKAAELALSGVEEEQKVGQRTTLDILDAQQELLQVEETLVLTQRDLRVAEFALLSATGQLTAGSLNLSATIYDPTVHYQAVRGKWYGLKTPDAR